MAIMRVNPTRMELTRLKNRAKIAIRGHKLLKDKRDELMKRFLEIVKENRDLRDRVETMIMQVHASFTVATAIMSPESLNQALMLPKQRAGLTISHKNIMSVNVPEFHFEINTKSETGIFPYGLAETSAELDDAVMLLSDVMQDLLLLAEKEKAAQLLAQEIEKTRRRVNALEYVLIPQFKETIRYITMKLDENERGNLTRLMKVKDMMVKQQIEGKKQ